MLLNYYLLVTTRYSRHFEVAELIRKGIQRVTK